MLEKLRRSALLVIDIQNDFCPGGRLEVKDGDKIIPVINKFSMLFPLVVATQDWHPEDHVSFAKNHTEKNYFDTIRLGNIDQVLWPEHCVQGSKGANFHPLIDDSHFNVILRKGTKTELDSYSAFFENDRKTSTGLEYYLRGLGVIDVYVSGLASDVCVFYTAMDAIELKYRTFLIEDAVKGVDFPAGNVEKTKQTMRSAGINFVQSDSLF
jgi:nicotinamidase/pyrazinamidase